MQVVYRYGFDPNDAIALPEGYRIIKVDWSMMHDEASLWAIVDPDHPAVTVHLETVPTGVPIPAWANIYLGSFQDPHGLVFHVFKS